MKNIAFLTLGLAFGDEGKGTIVDSLCREYKASVVVRYNGGPQAAHNVVDDNEVHHTFAQFGSGTLAGAATFLSQYMLVNPLTLEGEAIHLEEIGIKNPFKKMYIDERAMIVTPWHRITNQIRELSRGKNRHGSCGAGVGETVKDNLEHPDLTLRIGDLRNSFFEKLKAIRDYKIDQCRELVAIILKNAGATEENNDIKQISDFFALATQESLEQVWKRYRKFINKIHIVTDGGKSLLKGIIVFEGAQGVLLDENWGFPPYNTWTTTTFKNAEAILKEIGFNGVQKRIGITRTYTTRHGAGPFPSFSYDLTQQLGEDHNQTNTWQSMFLAGHLDLVALKYAIEVIGGLDIIAITHADALNERTRWMVASSYLHVPTQSIFKLNSKEYPTEEISNVLLKCVALCHKMKSADVMLWIQDYLNVAAAIISMGPAPKDKIYALDLTENVAFVTMDI